MIVDHGFCLHMRAVRRNHEGHIIAVKIVEV
jgi:hypothetical protein